VPSHDVRCCVSMPTLNTIRPPVLVTCSFKERAIIGKHFTLTFTVVNTIPNKILQTYVSMNCERSEFLFAGEMQSEVDLMPLEEYKFVYNVVPFKLGMLELPKFSISRKPTSVPITDVK
jgi:hypothetical protein